MGLGEFESSSLARELLAQLERQVVVLQLVVGRVVALALVDTVDRLAVGCPVDESLDTRCTRPVPRPDLNGLIRIYRKWSNEIACNTLLRFETYMSQITDKLIDGDHL